MIVDIQLQNIQKCVFGTQKCFILIVLQFKAITTRNMHCMSIFEKIIRETNMQFG